VSQRDPYRRVASGLEFWEWLEQVELCMSEIPEIAEFSLWDELDGVAEDPRTAWEGGDTPAEYVANTLKEARLAEVV
jgi:hypothetical protein